MVPPPIGKALRGSEPGESLHIDFITMFEGEGLLVLKDGFSGLVHLWDAKAYNAMTTEEAVIASGRLYLACLSFWSPMVGVTSIINWLRR